jgi:hypothetical protein
MIVYTGRRGLHIFDIDREKWIFNSKKPGYMYEDIYMKVRNIQESPTISDTDSQGYDVELDEESSNEEE